MTMVVLYTNYRSTDGLVELEDGRHPLGARSMRPLALDDNHPGFYRVHVAETTPSQTIKEIQDFPISLSKIAFCPSTSTPRQQ